MGSFVSRSRSSHAGPHHESGTSLLQFEPSITAQLPHRGTPGDQRVPASQGTSPEESVSLLARLLFTWAFPVLWQGYQTGRVDLEDLPPLPSADQPIGLGAQLCAQWQNQEHANYRRSQSLLLMLSRLSQRLWLEASLYQALMIVSQFMQPILLHALLQQVQDGGTQGTVLGIAFGIACSVMAQWIFAEYAWVQFVKCDLRWQAGLVHMVYRKAMYLPAVGSIYDVGRLQNHFATDCTKPAQNFTHVAVTSVIEAVVSSVVVIWNLSLLIGSGGLACMMVIVLFSPVQYVLTRRMKKMVQKQQEARDSRGRLFNQFLSAMRVVKVFRLEDVAWQQISRERREELKWQWRKRCVFPIWNFFGATISLFGTAAGFSWLVLVLDKPLEPAVAFAVLSWSNLLKSKIISIPNNCASLLDTYVGVKRVEQLLNFAPEEGRQWLTPLPAHTGSSGGAPILRGPEDSDCFDFQLRECDLGFTDGNGGHRGIHKLSLSVRHEELLLVCGSIGSGKTTLLQALAGTLMPLAGACLINERSTAYVAQHPWLLNGTLLENILFGKEHDCAKLEKVISSCCLEADLSVLTDGLHTLVGEDGIQLSGGQKQRVSLARALYSDADTIILDDVLSALDAHVGQHVWKHSICGMLAGRTRVLATHQIHYCSDPAVDRILILNEDGYIEHLGTYAELIAAGANLGALQRQLSGSTDSTEEATSGAFEGEDDKNVAKATRDAAAQVQYFAAPATDSRSFLASVEHRRLGAVQGQDFLEYLRACGGLCSVGAIVILIVSYYGLQFACNLELAAWANWNASMGQQSDEASRSAMKFYLTFYLVLAMAVGLGCIAYFLGIQLVSLRSSRVLHERFTKSLLWTELRFFDVTPTGRILNRCLKDFQLLDDRMPAAFRELVESFMSFTLAVVILLCFAWESVLAVPFFGCVYWKVMNIYRWPARDMKRLESISRSPMMSHFSDTIKGAVTIRAYRHDARFMLQNSVLMGDTQRTSYWYWTAQAWVSMVQEVLGTLLLAVITCTIGYRASTGVLSAGLAGLALSYAINMPRDLMWLSRRIASIEVDFVSIERVLEYIRLEHEEVVQSRLSVARIDASLSVSGIAISSVDVWFQYAPDLPWVLRGLSLQVPKGIRAAIVGRTGCGKSSFLCALARLYGVSGGCLAVHGRDVMQTPLIELRQTVRVLLQEPIFFQGSIRSNLLCCIPEQELELNLASPPSSQAISELDTALWHALMQAGLEKLVRGLPRNLDEPVQEGGRNFSHGERQLLCLARVLLDPAMIATGLESDSHRVLLCDEPTSACDLITDEHIHSTLLHGLPKSWTLIVICHRLHRIREFDEVYVLDAGQVAEHGPPNALLENLAHGKLAAMCRQQGML